MYEVIRPIKGSEYRMRCLHQIERAEDDSLGILSIPMRILVPHYEVNFFNQRMFQIEFDKKLYMEVSGLELSKLSNEG